MSTVVSAKIPEELKKKADKYNIQIGRLVREVLEEKIRAIENQMLSSQLDEISSKIGSKIKKEDVVNVVRSSRDER
ncbi:MAG: hypothetical protein COW26_05935 [Nitrosopumilales archaeon CG15_BIG_FIL_POST_REV_8_21_14_020_33_23]|nr:MAG: hypothetical protein COV65_05475 [Nitrosopumilales archaeon CG11_big_fil_rev_8_21_14_0_20_33_24]PIW34735.1 MAG: hypothetical protein COW26_05935 [Nitrosopumilales archaeon CG15_BIG_FIL_POST_REV_8_21_14_020_33_23]PIY90363.1 MAG: hypothetical protein COY74_01845 [Nitrosopumilales archaeon CG_4_10_14_0_8_um_filter_34_8]PJB97904.1 MAG: hypothetical protein CO079_04950 [Nitrosopumilales archaeon CG_4_9_14_0_8_um_filter_34_10]